jgi:hypothetical protein
LAASTHPVTWTTKAFVAPSEAEETKAEVKNGSKDPSVDDDVPVEDPSWKEKVTEQAKAVEKVVEKLWKTDKVKSPEEVEAEEIAKGGGIFSGPGMPLVVCREYSYGLLLDSSCVGNIVMVWFWIGRV